MTPPGDILDKATWSKTNTNQAHHTDDLKLRLAVLHRYAWHRAKAVEAMFAAFAPFAICCMAIRVKFDETLQTMRVPIDILKAQEGEEGQEGQEGFAISQLVSVICFAIRAFVSSTALPRGGYPWTCPLQFLDRGKAECMWEALQRALGCFQLFATTPAPNVFPTNAQVRWCW